MNEQDEIPKGYGVGLEHVSPENSETSTLGLRGQALFSQPHSDGLRNRTPFPPSFPLLVIADSDPLERVVSSSFFVAAKRGDINAAARLARHYVTDDVIQRIKYVIDSLNPIVLAVSSGNNRIPLALADKIGHILTLDIDEDIYQISGRRRSNASMFRRLWSRKKYSGLIIPGRSYMVIDDVLTQGGTLADLRGYVEAEGGKVVCAAVLTAARGGRLLRISDATLQRLRKRAGILEYIWQENFGFDFEALTNSEGRALAYFAFSLAQCYAGKPRKARKY